MLDGRLTLDSFSVGENIRMFQSMVSGVPVIYNAFNFDKSKRSELSLASGNLKFHYFMKDKDEVKVEAGLDEGFLRFCANNIDLNYPDCSDLYYSKLSLDLLSCGQLLQNGNYVYILGEDKYVPAGEKFLSYSLYQKDDIIGDDNVNVNDMIKTFVSEKYDSAYYDNAHYVSNKSLPIYDVDKDALDNISVITFSRKEMILDFINEFDKELGLKEISSSICFNFSKFMVDSDDFDSMLLDPILNRLASLDIEAEAEIGKRCFEWIISHLPRKSFLRFLNKIGSIDTLDYKTSLKSNANSFNEYVYSIDLRTKTDDIPVNYFSLKNLKTPELCHDYMIDEVPAEEFRSVKAYHYDMEQTVCANLFNLYNDIVVSRMNELVSAYIITDLSASIILGDSSVLEMLGVTRSGTLLNDLVDIISDLYPFFDRTKTFDFINAIINDGAKSDNSYWLNAFKLYMKSQFSFDLSKNAILFSCVDLFKLLITLLNEFLEKAESFLKEMSTTTSKKNGYENANIILSKFKAIINGDAMSADDVERIDSDAKDTLNEFNLMKHDLSRYLRKAENDEDPYQDNFILDAKYSDVAFKKILIVKDVIQDIVYKLATTGEDKFIIPSIFTFDAKRILENRTAAYPEFDVKANDYLGSYNDLFNKENEFSMKGSVLGKRSYRNILKSMANDIALTYRYDTCFDEALLHKKAAAKEIAVNEIRTIDDFTSLGETDRSALNEIIKASCINIIDTDALIEIITRRIINAGARTNLIYFENAFELEFEALFGEQITSETFEKLMESSVITFRISFNDGSFVTCGVFRINSEKYIFTIESNFSFVNNFRSTLNALNDYQFVDMIRGQHFYKESNYQKSNVFSLNIKNSGLAYDELLTLADARFSLGENATNADLSSHFLQIDYRQTDLKQIVEASASNRQFYDDVENYKYLKIKDTGDPSADLLAAMNEKSVIEQKIFLRNLFEEAIRKSIHRYAPANTTLWKIEYES